MCFSIPHCEESCVHSVWKIVFTSCCFLCPVFSPCLLMYIQVFFMLPSLLVMSVFLAMPQISLLESETRELCILFTSHVYQAYHYIPVEISLTSAGHRHHEKCMASLFGKRERQSHCFIDFQHQLPHSSHRTSTQALTMHFESQRLGGVVWCGHIFAIVHTAVGSLREPSCAGNVQEHAVGRPLDVHRVVAP